MQNIYLTCIVEDDPYMQRFLKGLLHLMVDYQFQINIAESLEDATRLLQSKEPDIILLDLLLPDSEGISTFEAISDLAPYTPIVVVTGTEINTAGRLDAEMDLYLRKGTINAYNFKELIEAAIEKRKFFKTISRFREVKNAVVKTTQMMNNKYASV